MLHEFIKEKGITPYRLAKILDVSLTTGYRYVQLNIELKPKQYKVLADYLEISVEDVMKGCGVL